jgi:hypothetical protein
LASKLDTSISVLAALGSVLIKVKSVPFTDLKILPPAGPKEFLVVASQTLFSKSISISFGFTNRFSLSFTFNRSQLLPLFIDLLLHKSL